ncbi:MAG: cell division protein FtsL, partial [Actinomycetota bacterium]|nr:cell division protein FtsL [Actinomycetota bacterium]
MTALPPLRVPVFRGVEGTQAVPGVQATQAGRLSVPLPELPPLRERPRLRVVPEPAAVRARRLSRLFTGLAAVAACFGLFGVVGVHVMLAQGQGEVARLSAEVEQQEAEQQKLRLQVAQLESPSRVMAAARELGMVTPSTVVPVAPASLADPPPTTLPIPRATTTTTVA